MIKKILISPIIAVGIIAGLTILLLSKKQEKSGLTIANTLNFFQKESNMVHFEILKSKERIKSTEANVEKYSRSFIIR